MAQYLSPGVYVEEVPSMVKPIVGVGTSTAGFVGILPETIQIPKPNPDYDPTNKDDNAPDPFILVPFPAHRDLQHLKTVADAADKAATDAETAAKAAKAVAKDATGVKITDEGKAAAKAFADAKTVSDAAAKAYNDANKNAAPDDSDAQKNLADLRKKWADASKAANDADPKQKERAAADNAASLRDTANQAEADLHAAEQAALPGVAKLCTCFADYEKHFGGFPADDPDVPSLKNLAHGVFGFFDNGGSRCYVMRYATEEELEDPESLKPFEAIDEIAIVAAPGIVNPVIRENIVDHCENMSDRFAILDSVDSVPDDELTAENIRKAPIPPDEPKEVGNTNYGALYFPWIQVFDTATKLQGTETKSDGLIYLGPSGHIAGVYARVDNTRGVFKAPANENIRGAVGQRYHVSKPLQDGLNPDGINCIREFGGNQVIWGARTIGGDANTDFKYISIRRYFLYLRKSIDHGTQWIVFEPNDYRLWGKIILNVAAFLKTEWMSGALFGNSPEEAFYVKCDAETNPPEIRDLGRVVTEIGVAVVKPAEFVIFRISQWAGPQSNS